MNKVKIIERIAGKVRKAFEVLSIGREEMNEEKSKIDESKTDPKLQEALDYIKDLFERAGLPCPEMREIPWEDIEKAKAEKRPGEVIVELVIHGEDEE